MGTIKVYDGVIGRKLREAASIAGTTQAEVLGCLVALWQWGMDNADEDGIVSHSGRKDIVRCLSAVSDDLATQIADALFKIGYVQEGDQCIVLAGWKEQQLWKYREEAARKRDSERKRKERAKKTEAIPDKVKESSTDQQSIKAEETSDDTKKKKPKKALCRICFDDERRI